MFMYHKFTFEGTLDQEAIKSSALSLWTGDDAPTGVGVLEGMLDPSITHITVEKPLITVFGFRIFSQILNLQVRVRSPLDLKENEYMVSYHPFRGPSKNLE